MSKTSVNRSGLVILTDPAQCPHCFARRGFNRDRRNCRFCGYRLALSADTLGGFADAGVMAHWTWFPLTNGNVCGWVHSDAIRHMLRDGKKWSPQSPEWKTPAKLPKDYGRKSTEEMMGRPVAMGRA